MQVTNVAHTFVDEWERVSSLLSELDVLLGFAELSVNAPTPYVRPTMLDTNAGELVLIGAEPSSLALCHMHLILTLSCKLFRVFS